MIVAGAGGGSLYGNHMCNFECNWYSYAGDAGGYISKTTTTTPSTTYLQASEATQTTGGEGGGNLSTGIRHGKNGGFGYGGDGVSWSSAGGSGWYGGGGGYGTGGSGGSGYIGSSNLISGGGITKHMTCYSCTTSNVDATRTTSNANVSATATSDYSKTGNGYARITYLGTSL